MEETREEKRGKCFISFPFAGGLYAVTHLAAMHAAFCFWINVFL
jgi:hypothetical protein